MGMFKDLKEVMNKCLSEECENTNKLNENNSIYENRI